MAMRLLVSAIGAVAILACQAAAPAQAQGAADEFYKGKTIQMLIGFQAGTGYDTYARTLARHLGKHLPGNPAIVPQNMTGAGGLVAANHIYNLAPKDGTMIGIFNRSTILDPLFGSPEAKFDALKYLWIGSMGPEVSVCISWAKSPFKTWEDVKRQEFIAAATSFSADTGVYPTLFNTVLGTKMKVIVGYRGGPEMSQAIEQGEAHGRCGWSWTAVKATKPDWLENKSIHVLLQAGLRKSADLPDVPLVLDLAANDRQRQILTLAFAPQQIAWPFVGPPGLPPERQAMLRKAFDAATRDPALMEEGKKLKLDIDPMSGAEVERIVAGLYQTPADVVDEVRKIMRPVQKK
jgi:tripartite-type tricarboxylate transporter receptor subunit TctC